MVHLLIVDQPAGVGYSVGADGESVTNTEEAIYDLYNALRNFYSLGEGTDCDFAKYLNNSFNIFGESYAGHYIPVLAEKIIYFDNLVGNTFNLKLHCKLVYSS